MTDQKASILFMQNYQADAQIVINQGGTSSGKTYAIQQVLFCLACETEKQVISVVGQDIPNLKAGAIRDAFNIYALSTALQVMVKRYDKTDRIFEFHNGSAKHPGANNQQGELIGFRNSELRFRN
jgi:phage terminase large subunit